MAFTFAGTTQTANRLGLDIKIYSYDTADPGDVASGATALMTIDFANVSTIELTGDRVYATGGQEHANKIPFNNPYEGTLTLSTQIMTLDLLRLLSGGAFTATSTNDVVFKNTSATAPAYYTIVAETVWQDKDGNVIEESVTYHKVSPQRALNLTYSGEGDPQSADVVFDLFQDDSADKRIMTTHRAAAST